jgi:hypothetical protein
LRVKRNGRDVKVSVTADGDGLVSHAGTALLAGLADRLGLTDALDRELEGLFERAPRHAPGSVLRDLAVSVADGGEHLCDLATLREQEALFGGVASDSTAYRLIERLAADPGALERVRAARAEARARAWRRADTRTRDVVIDIDATLVIAHSDKQRAAGNYKGGYGFHPMLAYLDGTGEALAGVLRPGNAGANAAADQIAVLDAALAQLPKRVAARWPVLMRADSAGATRELLAYCRDGRVRFSVGYDLTEPVRDAILALPETAWTPTITQDGQWRDDGAVVAEITSALDLSSWPEGSRVLVRRERPHPGAQLSFTDHGGHRFQAVLTDQPDTDIAYLEARHRGHARVEDRIRTGKDTGIGKLPFRDYEMNEVWLELSLIAQDLLTFARRLCLTGELARAEPKRLRHRLLHTAARLVSHARQAHLRLDRHWPWASELAAAFACLAALPAPTR